MKKILILIFLFIILNGYSQTVVKTQNDVYGTSLKFHNQFTKFGYWIAPDMPEMYSLTGVAAIDPRIKLRVNWFGTIKEVPLIFDRKAPAVRLFHIKNGEVDPVWDWVTGPLDTAGFSDQSFQQWECYWDESLNQFVNVMGSNGYRFFPQQVERLDEKFHSIGGNNISDPHDAQYIMHHGKLLMFHEYSWGPYSNMECVEAATGIVLGRFSTEMSDTAQSKIDILPCLDNRFLGSGEKEFYHTNSIDMVEWSGDSLLVATSERHTSIIRFAWFVSQSDGTYQTSPAFLLGSNSDSFNQIYCLNGDINIQAGHDFRFVQKYGDSIVCSYYDNHACGSGAKAISFTLYPRTKEIVLLDSVRPIGMESLTSQGLGSARKILSQDRSYRSVVDAPWCINWNAENAEGRYDTMIPGGIIVDTFIIPHAPALDEVGSATDVIFQGEKKFGLEFAYLDRTAISFSPVFSGFDLTGIKTSIQVAPIYRSNAYLPGQIKFPKQPEIQCRPVGTDTIELYLADTTFLIEMWSTGDTSQTIRVPKNLPNKRYFVRGKTDVDMRGLLYSLPFKLNDGGCVATNVIQHGETENFNLYPNPTSGLVQFEVVEQTTLQIFNSIGILVLQQDIPKGLNKIDFFNFPSGIYFLEGKGEKQIYTGKVVKN